MTIEMAPGFDCPYCSGFEDYDCGVYFDGEKFAWLRENHTDTHFYTHDDPDKLPLRFNNSAPTPGPCQHAVFLYGYCDWSTMDNGQSARTYWEVDWEWRSPELLQCDQEAVEALWELPTQRVVGTWIRRGASRKNPYLRLPYRYGLFQQEWRDYRSTEHEGMRYSATVHVFLARDVQTFVHDIQVNGFDAVERYHKLVEAGT